MKLDFVKTFVAIALSALTAYFISTVDNSEFGSLIPIVVGIEGIITLIAALGLKISWMRTMANVKIASWIFYIAFAILNFYFAKKGVGIPAFIITNGIILLIYILLEYSLIKANKE